MPDQTDPMLGRVIAGFRLLELIGEGGASSVYLSQRVADFQQRVALKLLRDGLHNPETNYRFRTEQRVLASLRHPEIVQLLDSGVTQDSLPYLVMEYIQGLPLDQYCSAHQLSIAQRVALILRVLDAVGFAHQRQVAHCDLKFSNILVTPNGELRLLDFGIAKLLQPAGFGPEAPARTDGSAFTTAFASPEQLQGRTLGTATDIYSIGVILYILLTGSHPFEAVRDQPIELARATVSLDPEPPSRRLDSSAGRQSRTAHNSLRPPAKHSAAAFRAARSEDLEGDLDSILLKALRKEPESRYASAEEFSADLRNFLEGRPVAARQGSAWYRVSKMVKRNRALATAAALIVVTVTVGIAGVLVESLRAQHSRTVARQRFENARELTSSLLVQFYGTVQGLDGSGRALDMLVRQSRDTLDRLAAESRGDPRFESTLSESYLKLAALLHTRPAEAVQALDRGLALADDSLAAERRDRQVLLVKTQMLELRGAMERALGRTAQAAHDAALARDLSAQLDSQPR
jgi:serine/threonine protein kinase